MKKSPLKRKPFRKKKTSEKTLLKRLHAKAWKVFSAYVRKRDPKCVCCGNPTAHAGHYIHGAMDFIEINVNGQCCACNTFKHGNHPQYAIYLEETYGHGILQELEAERHVPVKFTAEDLISIINRYTEKGE